GRFSAPLATCARPVLNTPWPTWTCRRCGRGRLAADPLHRGFRRRAEMKRVAKIIDTFGGLNWLRKPGTYIRMENPSYMRLVIEYVGEGPRGMPSISVAHCYEQNGDLMRDPEMVFAVNPDDG